jgi:hypothetical protein
MMQPEDRDAIQTLNRPTAFLWTVGHGFAWIGHITRNSTDSRRID